MKAPSILLVNLPSLPPDHLRTCFTGQGTVPHTLAMPMGLLYLSACLKREGLVARVGLLDYNRTLPHIAAHSTLEEFVRAERDSQVPFDPDVIGISLIFTASLGFFELALRELRDRWPRAILVVGGVHATNASASLLADPAVDYVLRGEGEVAFGKLVAQWSQGSPIDVRGIYSRETLPSGRPLKLAEGVEDLDTLPFPDWDLLDMEAYVSSTGRRRNLGDAREKRLATILTSRGCPFRCTYCSGHTVHGRNVRLRSVEGVLGEVKELRARYGIDLFVPEDDLFTANRRRTLELLTALRNLEIPHLELQFPSGLSVNQLDGEILDGMIACGTTTVNLAVESGSEHVQKHIIKKNCNLTKAKELVRLSRSKGLLTRCFIIFGFPGETVDLMQETVRYVKDLKADWCTFMIATPLLGSEMYDQFLANGYITGDMHALSSLLFRERDFDTEEISAVDLREFIYRLNLDVNFVHNANLLDGHHDASITLFEDILCTYPFHVFAHYGILLACVGKGDLVRAKEVRATIWKLIREDPQARSMYEKYIDLIEAETLGPAPAS